MSAGPKPAEPDVEAGRWCQADYDGPPWSHGEDALPRGWESATR